MPATPDVIVDVTRYSLSVLPADDVNRKFYTLEVELKRRGWIITDGHQFYGPNDGVEQSLSTAHHFNDYDDALDLARAIAPLLNVNGRTAAEVYQRTRPAPTPMTVYLSTPCADDACQHTLNWHRADVGCTVCACARFGFQPDASEAETVAAGTKTSYRLEYRQPDTSTWNNGTPGIGARWSYESRAKAEQRLDEARDRWPAYEHRMVTTTTTVTETVEPEPAAPPALDTP